MFALLGAIPAARLPACSERPNYLDQPWIDPALGCLQEVIDDPGVGELGFTALAVAPDETIYATRPYTGELVAIRDTNGDLLPDTPETLASGLTLPNGITTYDGAIYIAGAQHIYRWQDDELTPVVADVPTGGGFWTGGIAVLNDRIYVSTGAPCDHCDPDDPARGAVLSYALDGGDRQIVATGLRHPADLAVFRGELYTVDSAPDDRFATPDLDAVHRVVPGADFGFPDCLGAHDAAECAAVTMSLVSLPTASTPIGIAGYENDALPLLRDTLIVALYGSYNRLELRGNFLAAVRFDGDRAEYAPIMPAQAPDDPNERFTTEQMSYRGSGFFPQRPLDVAVSARGWVYISISGGRIIRIVPK